MDNRKLFDTAAKKPTRKTAPKWKPRLRAALSVVLLLAVVTVVWASERGVMPLVAASAILVSFFFLSKGRT